MGQKNLPNINALIGIGRYFWRTVLQRHAQWKYIWRFLPFMLLGILIGLLIGNDLPEKEFKIGMVGVIFFSLGLLIYWGRRKSERVPEHWTFAGGIGIVAGICTMIGNLAGAIITFIFWQCNYQKRFLIRQHGCF